MLLNLLAELDEADPLHLGRLLLILKAMGADNPETPIAGLTKLAKLDFLLRYPMYLERALEARHVSTTSVGTKEHEQKSVESAMVRYRFGPWDGRYRRFLNILSAMGLTRVHVEGRTVIIGLTVQGLDIANQIAAAEPFEQIDKRAKLLKHFNLTATNLMKFIYATFPEIGSLRSGKAIS
jgi:hypothetical protein